MAKLRYLEENTPPPKISAAFVRRILGYFVPYKAQLAGVVALVLGAAALGLVPTLLLQNIVDVALPRQNIPLLGALVGASVLATVVLNLLKVGQGYLSTLVSKKITFHMKNQMFRHLAFMPSAFFEAAKPGEITTRMNSDVDGIQEVFRTTAVNALNGVLTLSATLVALFAMNWKLALVGLATVPLFILPTRRVGRVRFKITAQSQFKMDELNGRVQEVFTCGGATLMKLCTTEEAECAAFATINGDVTKLQLKETLAGRWFRMAMDVFTTIGPLAVYFVGGLLLTRGEMTVGGILAFASLLGRLYAPVTQISNIHTDFMRSFALFSRIFDYLDMEQSITDAHSAPETETRAGGGEICFDNVDFAYADGNQVLSGVSFTARPGETVALVGPSGAGKSTVTGLIPRLYDVSGGKITVDGTDVRDMKLAALRGQVGFVSQEAYLFSGTVRENLLYGNETATDEEMEAACKAAYIHDFILALPKGYDTNVGNRGVKLSGGEKQRVAIARVILQNPRILLLDEATSALDSLSEHAIQRALENLLQNRTAIVIAHRLSTIVNADQILVMENGAIAQRGTHAGLLAAGGLYRRLYETQYRQGAAA